MSSSLWFDPLHNDLLFNVLMVFFFCHRSRSRLSSVEYEIDPDLLDFFPQGNRDFEKKKKKKKAVQFEIFGFSKRKFLEHFLYIYIYFFFDQTKSLCEQKFLKELRKLSCKSMLDKIIVRSSMGATIFKDN